MAEEAAAHHLLNVLEERDLNVDLDKVLAAFEDEDTKKEAAAWVNEYLNEETLLTKEELELYQKLGKKGLLTQYENDEQPTRPILDHELCSAIDALQSSTIAIEEQCRVLETQRDALMALKALDKPNLNVEHERNERRRKDHQEKARLDMAVEDLLASIKEQLTDTQRDIDSEKLSLKTYFTERLASDDKILTALPGIVSKIVTEPVISEDEKSIDQWCKAIISFRTAEVKARVDAVFLNSLKKYNVEDLPSVPEEELRERKHELQAEMETLHSEIESVAEMVLEHDLRQPMMENKERREREREQARSAWLNYVLSTLEYMSKRLDILTSHTKNVEEFQQALIYIEEAASKRVPESNTEPSSPSRKRTTSGPRSAFSPTMKLKPSKTLELPPALQDALRHGGIPLNHETIEALREVLIQNQLARDKKLEEHFMATTSTTHEMLAERLGTADREIKHILGPLYSHTLFSQVSLTDPKLEGGLRKAEMELADADQKLLNEEANQLSLNDPRVKAFLEKYGASSATGP